MHNLFHVSPLKQNTTKTRQVEKALPKPEKELEFKAHGNKKYEVKAIINNVVYG